MDIQKRIESRYKADQNRAALCILIFVVIVGFPVWWKTTEIPRATLPYEQISNIPELEKQFRYKLFLINNENVLTTKELTNLIKELSQVWELSDTNVTLQIIPISHPLPVRSNELVLILKECSSQHISILNSTISVCWGTKTKELLLEFVANYSKSFHAIYYRRHCLFPPVSGIQISFTYVLPFEKSSDILPQFYSEVDEFYVMVYESLRELINSTIDSQIYHFSLLQEFILQEDDQYYVTEANISQVVNRIESNLNSYTLQKLKLNYLIFTPSQQHQPLSFRQDYTGNLFKSARVEDWGSIILAGSDGTSTYTPVLPAALHDIKELLKFPYIISKQLELTECFVFSLIETNSWFYKQTQCYHDSARNNLNSLVVSISAVQNMFINTEIQQATLRALDRLERCREAYREGDLRTSYTNCKEGWEQSHKANYDPSILGLLYFPEDQKYAIYVPLFLPVAVILLRSVPGLWRWLQGTDN